MAELVDALDSKSSDGDIVPVRFRLSVPTMTNAHESGRLSLLVPRVV
jgi:hypothetical protein